MHIKNNVSNANPLELTPVMKWLLTINSWASANFDVNTQTGYLDFIEWYFSCAVAGQYFSSPIASEVNWANAVWTNDTNNQPITRLMYLIWLKRSDLQKNFNLETFEGRQQYGLWFSERGRIEHKLANAFMPISLPAEPTSLTIRLVRRALKQRLNRALSLQLKLKSLIDKKSSNFNIFQNPLTPANIPSTTDSIAGNGTPIVNIIGGFKASLGVGEHARNVSQALQTANAKVALVNTELPGVCCEDNQFSGQLESNNTAPINLLSINPDWLDGISPDNWLSWVPERYQILYAFWELNLIPQEWLRRIALMNEIWAPSRYIMQAWKNETKCPIEYMPIPIGLNTSTMLTRTDLALPDDSFLFFFNFDCRSGVKRKNPTALINAFKKSFPKGNEKVGLILKAQNLSACSKTNHDSKSETAEIESLCLLAQSDARIQLIDEYYSRSKMTGLMNACDVYVSLHRAEGFGIGMAESMLLGKPVIATNYSGNLDFTLPNNSCLVNCSLIAVEAGEYPYYRSGQIWAEPDVDHAAWYMLKLFSDSALNKQLSKQGQEYIRQNHSYAAIGQRYLNRLKQIAELV